MALAIQASMSIGSAHLCHSQALSRSPLSQSRVFGLPSQSLTPKLPLWYSKPRQRPTACQAKQAKQKGSSKLRTSTGPSQKQDGISDKGPEGFWEKVVFAFHLFFPPQKKDEAPRKIATKRLKVVLAMDRCAINNTNAELIKKSVVKAMSEYVIIEEEDKVEVNVSMDPDLGTIYSVNVPVKRVREEVQELEYETEFEKELMEDSEGQFHNVRISLEDVSVKATPSSESS